VPKWCSASCRQRAWEQRRAAASGLSAIEVVERVVEVPAPVQAPPKPRNQEWHAPLRELTRQIERGLVYDRHLTGIADEVRKVYLALRARGAWVTLPRPRHPAPAGRGGSPVGDSPSPLLPPVASPDQPLPRHRRHGHDPRETP
jgi:hypothetical protein